MKAKLILLALLFTYQAKAQVPYVPFDFETSVWTEFYYSNFFYSEYTDVVMDGDTTIDNQTWQKLRREGMGYYYDSPDQYIITDSMVIDEYVGAVRENSQKQVMYVSSGQTESTVLYDFNFEIGDTIELMDFGVSPMSAMVLSNDTVEVCGVLRNRYHLLFVDPVITDPVLIEGIGSLSGIIPRFELFESGGSASCYSRENCDCGEQLVAVFDVEEASFKFKVSPNPTDGRICIESDGLIVRVEVYDGFGRLVLVGAESEIDFSGMSSGVYFCRVWSGEGGFGVGRVVKE